MTNRAPGPGQAQNPNQQLPKMPQAKEEAPKREEKVGKARRQVRNFILQPGLQVRVGLYFILLSVAFAGALAAIIYYNFGGLVNSIVLLTDAEDEVRELFLDYWKGTQLYIYLAFILYLGLSISLSILLTHRLIGPTIAFRRHIRSVSEGRYHARTHLRKGDAFSEVADELNHLSEVMERTRGAPHNAGK